MYSSTVHRTDLNFFLFEQDAFSKGELILGTKEDGFDVIEGHPSGRHREVENCFTLRTPKRDYELSASTDNEKKMWVDAINKVLETSMTDEEKQGIFQSVRSMWEPCFSSPMIECVWGWRAFLGLKLLYTTCIIFICGWLFRQTNSGLRIIQCVFNKLEYVRFFGIFYTAEAPLKWGKRFLFHLWSSVLRTSS